MSAPTTLVGRSERSQGGGGQGREGSRGTSPGDDDDVVLHRPGAAQQINKGGGRNRDERGRPVLRAADGARWSTAAGHGQGNGPRAWRIAGQGAAAADADQIEINTAAYAEATEQRDEDAAEEELARVAAVASEAAEQGLRVAAGHGLTYRNVGPVVGIEEIVELNIGHNIMARAMLIGMEMAVREMKALLDR